MKKISVWAKKNQAKARWLIVVIHVVLFFLGILAGQLFAKSFINFSRGIFYTAILLFVLSCFIYPQRGSVRRIKNKNFIYRVQKTCDFTLAFSTFWMICFCSNNYLLESTSSFFIQTGNQARASSGKHLNAEDILLSLKYRSKKELTRQEKKVLKHEFLNQAKHYAKAKLEGDDDVATQTILIMLTIIAAVGLTYILAGLACSLSCSGEAGLAVLVAIAGLTGLICGSIFLIRAIRRIKKKTV